MCAVAILAQLCAAGLKTLNNYWSYVHDFSADEASNANFLCSCEVRVPILNDDDDVQPLKQLKLSFDPLDSLIPLTVPCNHRFSLSQVSFLSLLLSKDPAVNLANSVSLSKALAASHITMIRTGEFSVSARTVNLLFADKAKNCDLLANIPLAVFVTPDAQSGRVMEAVKSLDIASQWCMTSGERCPQIFEEFYRAYSS
ncbi:hypothetical protein M514_01901 [Trichuris suis]|uniref:Uncharacterized protein n=1 Tax=Trichuris suis TaxID=68888 RepID=A0A085NTI0_9BILA|nr:hypothetical protein M513_01901 [Trichuris suis]KFD72776.1 hypothetical protein M514_01901 [Trichuris suis]